jgi:phenylalanyl-tRNA synthetase beta chain
MDILTSWLRTYVEIPVDDRQLAEDLTLRGIAVEGVFDAPGGSRFEMDITTNRVDAMNHYGVAREAAAIYDVPLKSLAEVHGLSTSLRDIGHPVVEGDAYPVRIEAQDLCGRFTAQVIRGVTVKPATGKIAEYFAALGQKPISGPVDVTNFGWMAMGQPTHVFDLDKLSGSIVVRRAKQGEKLQLLDGSEKKLTADDLVVADEKQAHGLAGVMGGWDSRVTEETKNILVEAAWFDPGTVRASSKRHGLHTDASHRFERGADFNAAPIANALVTRMVVEQSGGKVVGPMTDVILPELQAKTVGRAAVVLRVSEVQRHLGTTLEDAQLTEGGETSGLNEAIVEQYLTALGCGMEATGARAGEYGVTLPSWRLDLEREIDLVEEVARVYGYNRFANTLPAFAGGVVRLPHAEQERVLRETLRALGYSEAISSSFVSAVSAEAFGDAALGAVKLGNPLSEEAGMLRPSLVPNMVEMLANNLNRGVSAVRLYEMGTAFTGSAKKVHERTAISIGATGGARATALYVESDALFFEVKGALEVLAAKFVGAVSFTADGLPAWIAAGRGARVLLDGEQVAVFGELSAAEAEKRKLRQVCVVGEVNATALYARPLYSAIAKELSKFQAVERDFSFVFPASVQWLAVESAVRGLDIAELQSVAPLEVFVPSKPGGSIAQGSYSMLVRVVLQSKERTLTEDELGGWSAQIVAALTGVGGVQRS